MSRPDAKTTMSLVKLVVFAVATIAAFSMLAFTISPLVTGGRSEYRAVFSDVTGLAPRGGARPDVARRCAATAPRR